MTLKHLPFRRVVRARRYAIEASEAMKRVRAFCNRFAPCRDVDPMADDLDKIERALSFLGVPKESTP